MLSILVVGSSGQLGSEIFDLQREYDNYSFIFLTRSDLDITCRESLEEFFTNKQIDIMLTVLPIQMC